jgi:dTMP kinase
MTYVTIEGVDGCGKGTLVEGLRRELGDDVVFTREPYEQIWTGEAVREALVSDTADFTDCFLFMADRAEHLRRMVLPALEDGRTVVSDRSADSTYAYQSLRIEDHVANPFAFFDTCYAPWDLEPDLTLYLDVPVDVALDRMDGGEKYERREFTERVRRNYEVLARMHEHRYVRIDGTLPPEEVVLEAAEAIEGQA